MKKRIARANAAFTKVSPDMKDKIITIDTMLRLERICFVCAPEQETGGGRNEVLRRILRISWEEKV